MNRHITFKLMTAVILWITTLGYTGAAAADKTTVAIIGTGDMGDSLGPRLAELGYPVVYGSRNPDSDGAKALVESTGHGARITDQKAAAQAGDIVCLLYTSPSPRDQRGSRMPSSA